MDVNRRDLAAGAAFMAVGLFFGLNAWLNLRIGQATSMGPGYFPILLGSVLVCLGAAIALTAFGRPAVPFGRVSFRGVGLVIAAIVFFAVGVRGLGLAPAVAGATLIAALSSGRVSLPAAALLGLALAVFSVLVFVIGLDLPYPVFGPWLAG